MRIKIEVSKRNINAKWVYADIYLRFAKSIDVRARQFHVTLIFGMEELGKAEVLLRVFVKPTSLLASRPDL